MCATGAGLADCSYLVLEIMQACAKNATCYLEGLWMHHHKRAKYFSLIFCEFSPCGTERSSSAATPEPSEGLPLARALPVQRHDNRFDFGLHQSL